MTVFGRSRTTMPCAQAERNISKLQTAFDDLQEARKSDKNAHFSVGEFQLTILDHLIYLNHEIKQLITEYEEAMEGYFKAYMSHLTDLHVRGMSYKP